MVHRLSSQLYLPNEIRIPIISNHTDMVKFDSPEEETFHTIVARLGDCLGK